MTGRLARRGVGLVLAAPSGAGKTSIARGLCASDPAIALSVSVTTRAPRSSEQDGIDYFFRTRAQFDALVKEGALLEWADVFGRSYGTPRAPVEAALSHGRDMVFDIDWQGHRQLRAALPGDIVGVFILPPSLADLAARLGTRGDDAGAIARRMAAARAEIAHCREFDHIVVNAELNKSTQEVRGILQAARLATSRQLWLERYLGVGDAAF